MAAPKGNRNAARAGYWRDVLMRELETYQGGTIKKGQALRAVARQLIEKGIAGDAMALRELGDRIDGRPHQAIAISGDADSAPIALHVSAPKPSK